KSDQRRRFLRVAASSNPAMKYVFDTQLNLTWLADWNNAGPMNWYSAKDWAGAIRDFNGGWVLPAALDTGAPGFAEGWAYSGSDAGWNVYGSENARRATPLAHMFYDTLGNLSLADAMGNLQGGGGLKNTGPFRNMQFDRYWSGTLLDPLYGSMDIFGQGQQAVWFDYLGGYQSSNWGVRERLYAVAVRPGDVAAVPEGTSAGMVLLGLVALIVAVRRRGIR
ncbi:MAG: hypothetical protein WCJ69_17225, partial [Betaproteobacteria bacterium]